ncbi:MAG: aquaporin [Oscillospiraceae bacterium]|nr:aquaporin [Oscillospiraceae bacterium]
MVYLAEFAGCFIFLSCGYAYTCNITLKKTLVPSRNYIELAAAWSLAVGFGLAVSFIMGGGAFLNPGVVLGNMILGNIGAVDGLLNILMEFLAAGAAMLVCTVFFWDSFKASPDTPKRGIFSAYPVERNIVLNFVQELLASFIFMFIVFTSITFSADAEVGRPIGGLAVGAVGACAVMLLALSFNSTGYSMNAMRSVFSSLWFVILPIPNKNGEKVDWVYQLTVNLVGSSVGGISAVIVTALLKEAIAE